MADTDHTSKHLVAFLGAPAGTYTLAALIWLGLKEECASVGGMALDCVRVGALEYSLNQVVTFATIVAVSLAVTIEVLMD